MKRTNQLNEVLILYHDAKAMKPALLKKIRRQWNFTGRATTLLACSATGEKLKPLVIGKAQKPRCFKNIKPEQLPVTYIANKKAWMTNDIFLAWIKDVNQETKRKRLHTDVFG